MSGNPNENAPRSPQTDPTNPLRQETTGEFEQSEKQNERRQAEPGLTDRERQERDPSA